VSWTVIVNEAEPVFPATSVAEQVTVVVPSAKVEPDVGEQVGESEPLTASVADAVKVTTEPDALVAWAVMLPGTVTAGGVVSATVQFTTTV
jgi:hypothetical protein